MKLDTLKAERGSQDELYNARTITLSPVLTELVTFLIFGNKKLVQSISLKV